MTLNHNPNIFTELTHLANSVSKLQCPSVVRCSSNTIFPEGLLPSASLPENGRFELGNMESWKLGNLDTRKLENTET